MRTVKVKVSEIITATTTVEVETEAIISPSQEGPEAETIACIEAGEHAMAIIQAVVDGINNRTV